MIIKRKLKNFSRSNGRDLIEHFAVKRFSIIEEEQREYGLKRSILKSIVKGRNKISESFSKSVFGKNKIKSLEKDIEKSISKRDKLKKEIDELDKNDLLRNSSVEKNLKENIPNRTYFIDAENSGMNHNKSLRNPSEKAEYRGHLKFLGSKDKAVFENSDDSILFDRKSGGNASLAHEIGHVLNRRSNNKSLSEADKIASISITKYNNIIDNPDINETKIFPSKRRNNYISNSIINNEKNATKTGLKQLKESGASSKELNVAKKVLNKSIEHYKEGGKIYKNRSAINRIKSYRNKSDN